MATAVHDPARRALLRGRTLQSRPLRPPHALVEAEFLEACTRCGNCLSACPETILRRGEGGYPVVDFSAGECTFCVACVDACAPRALDRLHGDAWSWRAHIGEACLLQKGVICASCRDVCPARAIHFPDLRSAPRVDASACTGCGACLPVCPTSAIALRDAQNRSAA